MPFMPRRIAVASITVVALGAGVAPALASAKTLGPNSFGRPRALAATIVRVTPYVRQRVSLTKSREPEDITLLESNIKACNRFAGVVIHVHAERVQHAAQLDWVTGVRLQAAGDEQLISGLYALAKNPTKSSNPEVWAGVTTLDHANVYVAHADQLLNLR